jgi:hypothetical protein
LLCSFANETFDNNVYWTRKDQGRGVQFPCDPKHPFSNQVRQDPQQLRLSFLFKAPEWHTNMHGLVLLYFPFSFSLRLGHLSVVDFRRDHALPDR